MPSPESPEPPVAIAIKSGRRLYRDVLAAWLGSQLDFTVVGHVAEDADLLELCWLRAPELVLLDTTGTVAGSLELLRRLRERSDPTRVVLVYERLSAGELAAARRTGVERLVPLTHGLPALLAVLREYAQTVRTRPGGDAPGLAEHERKVLALVATGHPVDRIAALLCTSPSAVEHSKRRIYAKLHVVNQSHAIARAAALGMVGGPVTACPSGVRSAGPPMVVLRGPDGPARQRVAVALLSRDLEFVADESTTPMAAADWRRHPGPVFLVLVDPRPGDWEGVSRLGLPVLWVCTGQMSRELARTALERGVVGVLPTDRIEDLLAPALTLAGAGCLTVGPQPAAELVALLGAGTAGTGDALPQLTVRESQILRSIAAGDTVRQTARSLGITPKTVENTQARLFRKLGCRNRAATLARAVDLGLLDLDARVSAPARRAGLPGRPGSRRAR
jgi:two-component system, NarL family, nitrate/nitrite response regulator NarL